jgi:tryptophan synthase beta subunit
MNLSGRGDKDVQQIANMRAIPLWCFSSTL